ncbi:MAG: 3-hydroxyacyl-CoA dehydrogenase family protein, partial [Terriglobia bacterium]
MPTETIHSVAVLGLGTMGHGIAQAFSAAGYTVSCFDESPAARASLHTRVQSNLMAAVESGIDLSDEIEPILSRLQIFDHEAKAVSDVDFVTEAIKEDLGVKQELFKRLESSVRPDTILASNSSSFPISQAGSRMKSLARALVTHWFNPPHLVPLVEVVPGPGTEGEVIQKTMAVLRTLGKHPILLRKELPGFLVNRIQVAIQREVWDLLERGVASAEE